MGFDGPECLFVLDHYDDYISGELDPEGVTRVENQREVCPNCDTFLGVHGLHGKRFR